MERITLPSLPVAWIALAVIGAGGWFVTGTRLMRLAGLESASPAVGALLAAAVVIAMWRWAREDRIDRQLAALTCPRCAERMIVTHDHARSGALDGGLTQWRCVACDYEHSRALTCERCAA
jgi:hypothetical protein